MKKSRVLSPESRVLRVLLLFLLFLATRDSRLATAQAPAPPSNIRAEVHPTVELNVHIVARHADGTIFSDQQIHNLRTTGGADWQASVMGAASQPASSSYIALTNDSGVPAAGDCAAGSTTCTLASEITTNGLARASSTYAHTNGTATWTMSHTWTATGTQAAQKAGMFNAASSGTMVFETAFTQVSLVSTDTLTITWTVSI
jgi:hypothetical protein